MPQLKLKTLTAMADSVSIGPSHQSILRDKLKEFLDILTVRKRKLEEEYRTVSQGTPPTECGVASGPSDGTTESLRGNQQYELDILHNLFQERLDQLYARFQREWQRDPREKVSPFPLPNSGSESAYLSHQLGEALGHALAEICEKRPLDPIEYLASWLRKYAENMNRQRETAITDLKVRLQQEEDIMFNDKQAIVKRERHQIVQEEDRRRVIFREQSSKVIDAESPEPDVTEPSPADPSTETAEGMDTHVGPKRVTVKDPESSTKLYTIEEKDSDAASEN